MKLSTYAFSSLYYVPPMPNRQQHRAAEQKIRKRPNGSMIAMPTPIVVLP